jgi:hypothetical protein
MKAVDTVNSSKTYHGALKHCFRMKPLEGLKHLARLLKVDPGAVVPDIIHNPTILKGGDPP